jgi:hypothetical protein
MRLIDADDFLDLFYVASSGQDKNYIKAVKMVVEDTPTIDAEPVRHGRWIQSKTVPSYHHCSCCKRAHNMPMSCNVYVLPYYCMDCGAKMDLEVQDD